MLNIVVQALKEDDCILGMTVTKVRGSAGKKAMSAGSRITIRSVLFLR